ncbi:MULTISPECIES: hypothetical protein [Actinosynnema]|uniref:hypothetical protein n=1 Tax=Actinosynnema TaxID=40566 RepID=UPI0020A413A7|nr:hypothetical protein [Actinosynnema pretiosum]MCP2097485.1 hypothetical protein [Actinosynnema pretiosum]
MPHADRHPRRHPEQYANWECLSERNVYSGPIVHPGHYEDTHYPSNVPRSGGSPPVCSCGWTRFHDGRRFVELAEHIADQGGFGSLKVPVTVHGAWGPRILPATAFTLAAPRR